MYTYRVETLTAPDTQGQLDALAAGGWRLVSAFAHPSQTADEEPKIISIWEKPA